MDESIINPVKLDMWITYSNLMAVFCLYKENGLTMFQSIVNSASSIPKTIFTIEIRLRFNCLSLI